MSGVPIHRTAISPDWIDYNGHLRDAWYALIASEATDALMDRVGLDAAYREASGCTLYTLEMHLHFLHEVKRADSLSVAARVLELDAKRVHLLLTLERESDRVLAGVAELVLLHVAQGPPVKSRAFPAAIAAALASFSPSGALTDARGAPIPRSRRMQLSRPDPSAADG